MKTLLVAALVATLISNVQANEVSCEANYAGLRTDYLALHFEANRMAVIEKHLRSMLACSSVEAVSKLNVKDRLALSLIAKYFHEETFVNAARQDHFNKAIMEVEDVERLELMRSLVDSQIEISKKCLETYE